MNLRPPSLRDMRAARAEHARVRKLNAANKKANQGVRRRNWERRTGGMDGDPEPWLTYTPAEKWADEVYDREYAWTLHLRERSPGVWREEVLSIERLDLRAWVANVVWWDYFADRPTEDRWDDLDQWLHMDPEKLTDYEPPERRRDLEQALLSIGYSGWESNRRAWGGFNDDKRIERPLGERTRMNGGKHHGRVGLRYEPGAGRGWGEFAEAVHPGVGG